jgi:hypothetical protein
MRPGYSSSRTPLLSGIKKSGKTIEGNPGNIEANDETSENNPPPIKDLFNHWRGLLAWKLNCA